MLDFALLLNTSGSDLNHLKIKFQRGLFHIIISRVLFAAQCM